MYYLKKTFEEALRYCALIFLYSLALAWVFSTIELTITTFIIFTALFSIVAAGSSNLLDYLIEKISNKKLNSDTDDTTPIFRFSFCMSRSEFYNWCKSVRAGKDERTVLITFSGEAYDAIREETEDNYAQLQKKDKVAAQQECAEAGEEDSD